MTNGNTKAPMTGWENILLVKSVTPEKLLQATKQEKQLTFSLVQVVLNDIAGDFSVRKRLPFFISIIQQK